MMPSSILRLINTTMYSQHTNPPFYSPLKYKVLDILYVIFSGLYLWGDVDHGNNFLKYVKPIPLWIMIYQLWPLRGITCDIYLMIWGIFFGSIGDILLLFGVFQAGAAAFLIGHILDVKAMLGLTDDVAQDKASLKKVLSQNCLFIVIWMVLITFSFWSISYINANLTPPGSPIQYVLDVYGTVLVMLTMGGFFYFFTTRGISSNTNVAGWLLMIGCLVFYASDNFLAHGKYDVAYQNKVSASLNSYFIMITYYVAQWLIGKGTFMNAVQFVELDKGGDSSAVII